MTTPIPFPDLRPLLPELIMIGGALLLLMAELIIRRKGLLGWLGILLAAAAFAAMPGSAGETLQGMFVSDAFSTSFKYIFLIALVLTILLSLNEARRQRAGSGEYYSLLLFATAGMMIMASARDLIIIFLGLELMALSTYILAGIRRHDVRSAEAAMKYFLLGAFSSALLLYGIAVLYGLTTTTVLSGIAAVLGRTGATPGLLLGMAFVGAALLFKIAAAPFHMWAPDVYEGSPTPVTAFLSVGPKAAGFVVIARVFTIALPGIQADWTMVLTGVAVLTMAVGNILALVQTRMKRMLAYSSIAHAGYVLIGLIVGTPEGLDAMTNYLLVYAFMNIGAFGVVTLLERGDDLEDYEGLAKHHPVVAAVMLLFLFSLAGIPPTAGFVAKFQLFLAAVRAGYAWLAVAALLFSVISAYYYLRVVMAMYMKDKDGEVVIHSSPAMGLALAIAAVMIIAIAINPSFLTG